MASCLKVVHGVATAVNVLCDVCMLGESVDALVKAQARNDDNTLLEKATLVNALALVGFSLAEIGGLCAGARSETLQKLKNIELLPRILNFPLQSASQLKKIAMEAGEDDSVLSIIIQLLEKGFVAPLADICRTAASAEAYYEQHFLDMTPEELEKAKRPIYKWVEAGDYSHWEIVGYKPVDPEECRKNLSKWNMQFETATVVRVAAHNQVVKTVVCDLGIPTIQRLAAFFGRFIQIGGGHGSGAGGPLPAGAPGPIRAPDPAEGHGRARAHGRARGHNEAEDHHEIGAAPHDVEEELNLDLLNYPHIPEPLHGDLLFQQYVCPITHQPIRDPVRDPTNNMTLYERHAIVTWLRQTPVSPFTRRSLKVEELQEVPVIKNQINHRLQEYQDALQRFIQEHAAAPVE